MTVFRFLKSIYRLFVISSLGALTAIGVEPKVINVPNVRWGREIQNLINLYIKSKNINRKNLVLILRREVSGVNLFYLCLLSKGELRDVISESPEIPNGYGRLGTLEVLMYDRHHLPFFTMTSTRHLIDWYEHRGVVMEGGHEITTNVEPFITVFSLNGNETKKLGTLVADPTSSILPSLPIE